jgi:hypothetical protein
MKMKNEIRSIRFDLFFYFIRMPHPKRAERCGRPLLGRPHPTRFSEVIEEVHRIADIVRARMEKGGLGDEE